jgi:hypothetical protein
MPFARKPDAELTQQARDSRIRRAAAKAGLRAMKSRWMLGTRENQGGWILIEPKSQRVVDGRFYSLTDQAVLERFS